MCPVFDMIYGMGDPVRSHSGWETMSSGEFYLVGIERHGRVGDMGVRERERYRERKRKEEGGKREAEATSSKEWTEK